MKAYVVVACSIAALVAGTQGAATQQTTLYAAIAYSPTKRVIGTASDNVSRDEAETVAAYNCRAEPGAASDCKNAAWVQNGCASLAVSSQGAWGGGFGTNTAAADNSAIAQCAKYAGADASTCRSVKSVCTGR